MPTHFTTPMLPPPFTLAQLEPYDSPLPEPAPEPPAPRRSMSFSDLKQGMRDVHDGKVDDSGFRNGIIVILTLIGLVALIIHLRQRRQNATAPDSLAKLGWELSRLVRFPVGTRWLLLWVARSTRTPFASLLLSENLFNKCLHQWEEKPTFSVARHWGASRLQLLRQELFTPATTPVQ